MQIMDYISFWDIFWLNIDINALWICLDKSITINLVMIWLENKFINPIKMISYFRHVIKLNLINDLNLYTQNHS